jgi:hypothetical protein
VTDLHRQMADCFFALARFGYVSEFIPIVGRAMLGQCRRRNVMDNEVSEALGACC